MAYTDYWAELAKQNSGFGSYGTNTLNSSLGQPTGLAESSFSAVQNANVPNYSADLAAFNAGGSGASGSLLDSTKELLGNESFMKGAMGAGQLGLGLAQYLQNKPILEEQLKGLKQNRQFAAADQQRRNTTAANFDRALT